MSVRKVCFFLALLIASHVQCETNRNIVKKYSASTLDSILDLTPFVNYPQSSWEQCSYFCARDGSCHGFTLSNEAEQNTIECNLWSLPDHISLQTHLSGEFFLDSTKYATSESVLLLQMVHLESRGLYRSYFPFSATTFNALSDFKSKTTLNDKLTTYGYANGAVDNDFVVLCNREGLFYCDVWNLNANTRKKNRYHNYQLYAPKKIGFLMHRGTLWVITQVGSFAYLAKINKLHLASGTWTLGDEVFPCSHYFAKVFPISDSAVVVPGGRDPITSNLLDKTWILEHPTGRLLETVDKGCPINPLMKMTCDMISSTELICSGTSRLVGLIDSEEPILATFHLETKVWNYVRHELFTRNRAVVAFDKKALLLDIVEPYIPSGSSESYSTKFHLLYDHSSGEIQELPQLVAVTTWNKFIDSCNPMCPFHVKYMDKMMKRSGGL